MNLRKVLFIAALVLSMGTSAVYAQEETEKTPAPAASESIGVSFGIDYWSNYFWRGVDFYGANRGVFFPWVSYAVLDTGLAATVSGEYASEEWGDGGTNSEKGYNGIDIGLDYSYSIEKLLTIGAGAWYYWFYRSDDKLDYNGSFSSLYASVSFDMLPQLTPSLTYTHDFYMDKDATTTEERFKDFYIQLSLAQDFSVAKSSTLTVNLFGSYFNYKSADLKGISDLGFSLKISTTAGMMTYYGKINYAFVPYEDFYTYAGGDNDKHRWWADFGVSIAL